MRKAIYGALTAFFVAIGAVLFIRRRSQTPRRSTALAPASRAPLAALKTSAPINNPPAPITPESAAPNPAIDLDPKESGRRSASLDRRLFLLAIIIFALTRFIGLDRFPVYFFTDEAIQSVQAANLVHNGFRDANGELFPTYFQNGSYYNLSVSVYAQVIPYQLFGFSIIVTRGVSALMALSGAIAIGFMLRDIFKVRFWWLGSLVLSIVPAFFLHSRTAFETVFGVSLYAWFLYFYLRYRGGKTKNLYWAILFGALTFYAYSPMQAIMAATAGLLFLSDLRYHLRQWRTLIIGAALLLVFALPYLRFQSEHPDESWLHLRILGSYLIQPDLTTSAKLNEFADQYFKSLGPSYWFSTQDQPDLIRHVMKDYGRLPLAAFPFMLIGLIVFLRKFKSAPHRAILIALIVTPIGTAITNDIQVYRILSFVVPASILISIGLITLLMRLLQRVDYKWLAIGTLAVLGFGNFAMLNDALVNGPTWYHDYTIGGLQYGGKQIFEAVRQYLRRSPDTQVIISPTWANGTDLLLEFFLPNDPRVRMGNIDAYKTSLLDLPDNTLFVMTAEEYARTIDDPKFTNIRQPEKPLPYPDGSPGFYFVQLNYAPQAAAIFAAQETARHQPVEEDFQLGDQTVHALHSRFDSGQIKDLFDGDTFTLARGEVDNPWFIELTYPQAHSFTGLTLTTGTLDYELTVQLYPDDNSAPKVYTQTYKGLGPDPTIELPFDSPPASIKKVRIELKDLNNNGDDKIHVREITLK